MKITGMAGLAWGVFAVLSATGLQAQDGKAFIFHDAPGQSLDVVRDGKVAGRYMYAYDSSDKKKREETFKPYLHVFDAEGKAPITKGAGGEFPHHRGIFIGWSKVSCGGQTYDRWHMKGGEQIHRKFGLREADAAHATFTSLVDWTDESGRPILTEERAMTFRRAPLPDCQIIDFASKITAPAGDAVLDGDPEHAGIQFRSAAEVDRTKTSYVFPGEATDTKTCLDLPWIGATISLNGKLYSIVEMNHPGNPQGTKTSATRDYGRFGFFPKASIKAGESATFQYRFLIAEGGMPSAEAIQKICNEFTGRSDPAPKLTVKSGQAKGAKSAEAAAKTTQEISP